MRYTLRPALALATLAVLGVIAAIAATPHNAQANFGTVTVDCTHATLAYQAFPSTPTTINYVITSDGVAFTNGSQPTTGASGQLTVTYTPLTGHHALAATFAWHLDGADHAALGTATVDCSTPTTSTQTVTVTTPAPAPPPPVTVTTTTPAETVTTTTPTQTLVTTTPGQTVTETSPAETTTGPATTVVHTTTATRTVTKHGEHGETSTVITTPTPSPPKRLPNTGSPLRLWLALGLLLSIAGAAILHAANRRPRRR